MALRSTLYERRNPTVANTRWANTHLSDVDTEVSPRGEATDQIEPAEQPSVPPRTSADYIQLVSYPWTDSEIDAAADQGQSVHWLATTGRVPIKTAHHMGPRRRVPYKRHAEALNTQAHPGHIHEQTYSSPKHKDRAVCVFAVLVAVVFGTAFALALTIQLWSEYRVDREGLMHLQVKYSKVHSEAAVTADRVEVKSGTMTFPAATSSSSLSTGANNSSGEGIAITAGASEAVNLEVRGSGAAYTHSLVRTSTLENILVSSSRVDAVVAGLSALNISRATTIVSRGNIDARNLTVSGAFAASIVRHTRAEAGTRALTVSSAIGPVFMTSGQSVTIESSPATLSNLVSLSAVGRNFSVTAGDGPLRIRGDEVRLNLSLLHGAAALNSHAILKACVCPASAPRAGAVFVVAPQASCAEATASLVDVCGSTITSVTTTTMTATMTTTTTETATATETTTTTTSTTTSTTVT